MLFTRDTELIALLTKGTEERATCYCIEL